MAELTYFLLKDAQGKSLFNMTLRKGDDGLPGIQVLPPLHSPPLHQKDCRKFWNRNRNRFFNLYWKDLETKACLGSRSAAAQREPKTFNTLTWKPRSESGLDCLAWAISTQGTSLFNMTLRKGDDGLPGIQVLLPLQSPPLHQKDCREFLRRN